MIGLNRLVFVGIALVCLAVPGVLRAQGTEFTYQGRLENAGVPADGSYDLTFALYDNSVDGLQLGATVTNLAILVSNGRFTAQLDFGDLFADATRWLHIGVRTNGGGDFTLLSPRQQITATPYAIAAARLNGALPSGQLSGTYPDAITFNNPSNNFAGNGAGLVDISITSVQGLVETTAQLQSQIDNLAQRTTNKPLTTGAVTNTSQFDTNGAAQALLAQQNQEYAMLLPENFGAVGNARKLTNVVTAAGSATIISAGAGFTPGDVGKVAVLYTNKYNTEYILTTIAACNSSTSVDLAVTVPATLSGLYLRFGTDDSVAIQTAINAAWTAGNATIKFRPVTYMLAGPLTNYSTVGKSELYIPSQLSGQRRSISFEGASAPIIGSRGLSYELPDSGSVLFCPVRGLNGNDAILGFNPIVPLSLTLEQVIIRDLSIILPNNPHISGINAKYGGNLVLNYDNFCADYPSAYNLLGTNRFQSLCDPNATNAFAAVVFPTQNNPAVSIADNVQVMGWPVGMYVSEHAHIYGGEITLNCVGLAPVARDGQSSFDGWTMYDTHLANIYNFAISTNYHGGSAYYIPIEALGLNLESTNYWNGVVQVYDPTASLRGYMSYHSDVDMPYSGSFTSTNLTTLNLFSEGYYVPKIASGPGSPLSLFPANGRVDLIATNNPTLSFWGRPDYVAQADGSIKGNWAGNRMELRSYLTNGWRFLNHIGAPVLDLSDAGVLTGNGGGLINIPVKSVVGLAGLNTTFQSQLASNTANLATQSNQVVQLRATSAALDTRLGELENSVTAAVSNSSTAITALNKTSDSLSSRLGLAERATSSLSAAVTALNAVTNNLALTSLRWQAKPTAFSNITCVRIPVATNAGVIYYLTLSTNAM